MAEAPVLPRPDVVVQRIEAAQNGPDSHIRSTAERLNKEPTDKLIGVARAVAAGILRDSSAEQVAGMPEDTPVAKQAKEAAQLKLQDLDRNFEDITTKIGDPPKAFKTQSELANLDVKDPVAVSTCLTELRNSDPYPYMTVVDEESLTELVQIAKQRQARDTVYDLVVDRGLEISDTTTADEIVSKMETDGNLPDDVKNNPLKKDAYKEQVQTAIDFVKDHKPDLQEQPTEQTPQQQIEALRQQVDALTQKLDQRDTEQAEAIDKLSKTVETQATTIQQLKDSILALARHDAEKDPVKKARLWEVVLQMLAVAGIVMTAVNTVVGTVTEDA